MSDPPPKPMSLKDRIKAFESSSTSSTPSTTAPPPPRRFGAGGGWKPKPKDASDDTTSSPPETAEPGKKKAFSAADAAESIKGGAGSLKERMALLQGKGAFGSGDTSKSPPPVPANKPEKKDYKWKIPSQEEAAASADTAPAEDAAPDAEAEAEVEDPEVERRAAIAARMARLGGAKFGAPAVFGGRPGVKRTESEEQAQAKEGMLLFEVLHVLVI